MASTMRTRDRSWVARFVAAAVIGSGLGVVVTSLPASAYPSSTVSLVGHGYGHGHGMGQWGALGYALSQTGYQSILGRYYGGTSLVGGVSDQPIRVALTENNDNCLLYTSDAADE